MVKEQARREGGREGEGEQNLHLNAEEKNYKT